VATLEELKTQIRKFRRQARLLVFRTTTPAAGADFFVQRAGGPEGETNGIEITDLKFTWSVSRDLSKHPNQCDIQIINLAPSTRAAMKTKPLTVDLYAGYDGVTRLIFSGDVIDAYSKQEGPDRVTVLQVGDGSRAYARSRVNRSYKRGTSVKTLIKDAARSMGQALPKNVDLNPELNAQIESGVSLSGATRDELTRLLSPYGYDWSFQNGRIQMLRDEDNRKDTFVIDESCGMLDSPKFGHPPKNGKSPNMEIRTLLYPELVPGGRAEVRSEETNGLYKIVKVKHSGDTFGDEWFTDVELQPL
jgi:hypothetical protein